LGPDDQFYGYLFFARGHVVIKAVDEKMMYMYDLESPLYIEDGPSLWEEKNLWSSSVTAAKMGYNQLLICPHFPKADIVISRCKMKFPYFQVFGTLSFIF